MRNLILFKTENIEKNDRYCMDAFIRKVRFQVYFKVD